MPKEVKWEILKKFVDKCCVLHAVAFFQWRIKYPSEIKHDIEELNEIVMGRINHFNKAQSCGSISEDTLKNSKIDENFLVKYEFIDEYKPFFINSFKSIGL